MSNSFTPTFDSLPRNLPIFPLGGVILLPGRELPLNIFEPRYLSMVLDALGNGRMIGMIQPAPGDDVEIEPVRATGCAGRITSFTETDDGRLLVVLTGVCRFQVGEELPPRHGYRSVVPDWSAYDGDLDPPPEARSVDRDALHRLLKPLLDRRGLQLDWEQAQALPDDQFVDAFAMSLPLPDEEKQALLEARGTDERAELLAGLAGIALSGNAQPSGTAH